LYVHTCARMFVT